MNDPILAKISRWAASDEDRDLYEVGNQIKFLEEKLFYDYEPSKGPHPDFWQRLISWLDNVDDEDQKTLLRLVPYLFFIGREEFDTLYRAAYNGPIAKWLIDQISMALNASAPEDILREAVINTWFCPITDSMRINAFYHVNQIPSKYGHRPDWRSLNKFGSEEKIKSYIQKEGIKRIVLLEDFVGSGNQAKKSIEFAAKIGVPLLFLPFIACQEAIEAVKKLEIIYPKIITLSHVIALGETAFVKSIPIAGELLIAPKIRDLVLRTYHKVSGKPAPYDFEEKPYGPFGYKGTEGIGGLIIMYSNCPNNTLPIIHHESNSWKPLFPRSSRV